MGDRDVLVYAAVGLPSLFSFILATTDTQPPAWSLPAVIFAMGSALVYAYRQAESARVNAEKEKYDLAGRVTLALAESSQVLARVLDTYPEEQPRPLRPRRRPAP